MQLAQNYPNHPPMYYGGYENKSSYPSQSVIDPRIAGQHGYPQQFMNAQHHYVPTVYPDAVYPSQYLPQGNPHVVGHQHVPLTPTQTHYNAQYPTPHQAQHPHNLPFAHQPHYSQGSYITQTRPVNQQPRTQVKQVKQVIYEQQPLNIPQPVRNIQYVPQLNRYMDYVQERIKVPVEKYYTDYYQIQHVTDFVPRQYEQSVIEMVPEQIIRYRLEYVPVERKIVHMPKSQLYDENGLFKGVGNLADRVITEEINVKHGHMTADINQAIYNNFSGQQKRGLDESLVNNIVKDIENEGKVENQISKVLYQGLKAESSVNRAPNSPSHYDQNINRNIYSQVSESRNINSYSNLPQNQLINQGIHQAMAKKAPSQKSRGSRRRSNFVTSDGYFPNYEEELRNMESSLSASRERYL